LPLRCVFQNLTKNLTKLFPPVALAVPTHFYKVVFGKDENGAWRAVGFVAENRPYDMKRTSFEDTIKSIDWIEARTGITFMPDLDDALASKLKRNPGRMW
jgi:DNA/RNA endonuclease G (NUC1)